MKKIKTINKLLSSLTLLSPLSGIGFNNQYENTQKVITENTNNSLNNYVANQTNEQRTMGGITVNVDGTTITGYVEGEGELIVDSDITEIAQQVFLNNKDITSLDLSQATNLTTIGQDAFENTIITSLDLSNATSLTTIGNEAFNSCLKLSGGLVITSSVTNIGNAAFQCDNITSLDLSQATSLTTIGNDTFSRNFNLAGKLVIPSKLKTIGTEAFSDSKFDLLDFSNATSLTTIENGAFQEVEITSLDLSHATNLTTIADYAFAESKTLTGDLVIPSSVTSIGDYAFNTFGTNTVNNVYFYGQTPPTIGTGWLLKITGKIYVPSEQAKQAYLAEPNFGFNEDQIEIGLPPEPSPKKSNTGLILGLVFGLGIPIVLATVGFGIWYFTKKKKNNS